MLLRLRYKLMMKRMLFKSKPVFLFIIVVIFYSIFAFNVINSTYRSVFSQTGSIITESVAASNHHNQIFVNRIDRHTLNKLFGILQNRESLMSEEKRRVETDILKLISFNRVKEIKNGDLTNQQGIYKDLKHDFDRFLKLSDDKVNVEATQAFVDHLINISTLHSITNPRDKINKIPLDNKQDKPVILIAANYKYFHPLTNALGYVQQQFPDLHIIIYDLGLSKSMRVEVKRICKACELRYFDEKKKYKSVAPHVTNLINYSWKPLLIREVLNEYKTILYIDTSIKLKSSMIESILQTVREIGMMSRYLHDLLLPCYTDPRMFAWFGETEQAFERVHSAEANFIILHRNFLTEMVMKTWVSCALDEHCIAPKGSHIYGSLSNKIYGCSACGCHRFDQDALTISLSYFYGFPTNTLLRPAFALTNTESFFYKLDRRDVGTYIVDQFKSIFSIF